MTNEDFIHPFESCGLGNAPFKFSHFKLLIHYSAYQIDGKPDPFAETRAGGACEYCGNSIKNGYFFESSDGKVFGVGSDCAEKAFIKSEKEWKELKQKMRDSKYLYFNTINIKEKQERERIENEKNGFGFLTNKELKEKRMEEERIENEEKLRKLTEKKEASKWVGSIGDKSIFTMVINYVIFSDDRYGGNFFHIMTDNGGNTIINKGAKKLGKRGDKIEIKATIKEHKTDKEGYKQTIITRAQSKTLKIIEKG